MYLVKEVIVVLNFFSSLVSRLSSARCAVTSLWRLHGQLMLVSRVEMCMHCLLFHLAWYSV